MDNIKDIIPQEDWGKLIGPRAQAHCAIEEHKDGELIVCVDSSTWLFQLNARKAKLLAGLKEQYPELKNLRFKIGTLR
jgi:predicted nucleic acid-binding Zn ribbon protein